MVYSNRLHHQASTERSTLFEQATLSVHCDLLINMFTCGCTAAMQYNAAETIIIEIMKHRRTRGRIAHWARYCLCVQTAPKHRGALHNTPSAQCWHSKQQYRCEMWVGLVRSTDYRVYVLCTVYTVRTTHYTRIVYVSFWCKPFTTAVCAPREAYQNSTEHRASNHNNA